jgi:hemolysin activation/secretion protein
MGTTTEKKVNIRKGPNLKDPVLCRVTGKGTSVEVLGRQDDWLKIKVGSCVGWVGSAFITINGKKPIMVQAMEEAAVAREKPFVPREEAVPTIIAREEAPAPIEAPEEEEKEEAVLYVKDFMFAGNTVIDTETLQKITESFKGRELTVDEMALVAETITMAYQERGYILARAYVPEQEIRDGILKIYIAEGNIGKLKISGNKYYKDRVIKRYFKKQLRDRVVREGQLERALLLTNDMPSLTSKVILEKGEEPLTVDMVLDIEDKFAAKLSVDYNNFGSEYIAKHRGGVNVEMTDPWWGSTFGFRGVGGGVPGGLRAFSSQDINDSLLWKVDWNVPVGSYGTKLSANFLASDYVVGHNLADLKLKGDTEIYGGRITHPILREKNKNLNLTLGYDHKLARSYQMDEPQSLDELNNYYIALDFDNLDRFLGKNIASISYCRSERQIHEDLPSGRSHPKKNTDIYSMDVARIQKIYGYTNLLVRGSGRLCEQRLVSLEQNAIGGYGSVRGHDTSLFMGDSGYTLSGELMFAPPYISDKVVFGQRIGQMVQFALFFDHGGVFISNLEAGEDRNNYLSGYGGGVRLFYKDIFSLKFDVAFPTRERLAAEKERFHYLMIAINFL